MFESMRIASMRGKVFRVMVSGSRRKFRTLLQRLTSTNWRHSTRGFESATISSDKCDDFAVRKCCEGSILKERWHPYLIKSFHWRCACLQQRFAERQGYADRLEIYSTLGLKVPPLFFFGIQHDVDRFYPSIFGRLLNI